MEPLQARLMRAANQVAAAATTASTRRTLVHHVVPPRTTAARQEEEGEMTMHEMQTHIRDLEHLVRHYRRETKDLQDDAAALHAHLSFAGMLEAERLVKERSKRRQPRSELGSRAAVFSDGLPNNIAAVIRRVDAKMAVGGAENRVQRGKKRRSDEEQVRETVAPLHRGGGEAAVPAVRSQQPAEGRPRTVGNGFAKLSKPSRLMEWSSSEGKEALKTQHHFLVRPIRPRHEDSDVQCESIREVVWAFKHIGVPLAPADVTHLSGDGGEFSVEVGVSHVHRMPTASDPVLRSDDARSKVKFGHRLPNFVVEKLSWDDRGPSKLVCHAMPPGRGGLGACLQRNAAHLGERGHVVKSVGDAEAGESGAWANVHLRWDSMHRLETSEEDVEVASVPLDVRCFTTPTSKVRCRFYRCTTCLAESDVCRARNGLCRHEPMRK